MGINSSSNLQRQRKNVKPTQEKFDYIKIVSSYRSKIAITKLKENQRTEKNLFSVLRQQRVNILHFKQTIQMKYRCSIGIYNSQTIYALTNKYMQR